MNTSSRFYFFLALALVSFCCARAQESPLQRLMQAGTVEDFSKLLPAARQAGASRQMVAEAKLVLLVRTEDMDFLKGSLPELETAGISFNPAESLAGLSSVEQYRGLLTYIKALRALREGDEVAFRKGIERSFWLYPEQAGIFGRAVARHQLGQRMARVTIDFETPLLTAEGQPSSLSKVLGTGRGLLLFLWQSPDDDSELPGVSGLSAHADALHGMGIKVVGLNTERNNGDLSAKRYMEKHEVKLPWLAELAPRILSRQLEFGTAPRAVVISDRGRVLFNGSPNDPAIWDAVRQLAPAFKLNSR